MMSRARMKIEHDSPFLNEEELFTNEAEWQPRLAALTDESRFLAAFEPKTEIESPAAEQESARNLARKLTHLLFLPHFAGTAPLSKFNMNPAIYDGADKFNNDPTLQACLDRAIKDLGFNHIKVALVDLTENINAPKFAGSHHQDQGAVANLPKLAAMLAAFQLRRDVAAIQDNVRAATLADLFSAVRDQWADAVPDFGMAPKSFTGRVTLRRNLVLLDGKPVPLVEPKLPQLENVFAAVAPGDPVAVEFRSTGEDDAALRELMDAYSRQRDAASGKKLADIGMKERLRIMMAIVDDRPVQDTVGDFVASTVVRDVGFLYIASLLLQSGLYDPDRKGGLWLGSDYARVSWKGALAGGAARSATAGAVAAFLTLLAQDKLADAAAGQEMRKLLDRTPSPAKPWVAQGFKAGLEKRFGEGSLATILSRSGIADGFDECAYIERTVGSGDAQQTLRYVAVALRAKKGAELQTLIGRLDDCIVASNPPPAHPELVEQEEDQPPEREATPFEGALGAERETVDELPAEAPADEEVNRSRTGSPIRVGDSRNVPFRWICLISVAYRDIPVGGGAETHTGARPLGTGVLISPRHVLTAAHVLHDIDKAGTVAIEHLADRVFVTLGQDGSNQPFGQQIEADSWKTHRRWRPGENSQYDIAVITLPKSIGDETFPSLKHQPLCFWGSAKCGAGTFLDSLPVSLVRNIIGSGVNTAGYPVSKNEELWCFSGRFSSGTDALDAHLVKQGVVEDWYKQMRVFHMMIPAEKRQSGSPVWLLDNGKRFLIGIVVQTSSTFTVAVAVTAATLSDIQALAGLSGTQPEIQEHEVIPAGPLELEAPALDPEEADAARNFGEDSLLLFEEPTDPRWKPLAKRLRDAKLPGWMITEIADLLSRLSGAAFDAQIAFLDQAAGDADPRESVRDVLVRLRIDRFFEDAAAEYTLSGSAKVRVRGMFRINLGFNDGASWSKTGPPSAEEFKSEIMRSWRKSGKTLSGTDKLAIHLCVYGRSSSEDIRSATQALIDAGEFTRVRDFYNADLAGFLAKVKPSNFGRHFGEFTSITDEIAVRLLQWEYAIGVDCAGYVQRAFLEAASRPGGSTLRLVKDGAAIRKVLKDASRFGLKDLGDENLFDLKKAFFRMVTPPEARPGDLIILKAPQSEGHTVLLRDRHVLIPAEWGAHAGIDTFAGAGDRVHTLEVEASFGRSNTAHPLPNPLINGVQRRIWLFNEANGKWADADPAPAGGFELMYISTQGPYRHPLQAIYHPIAGVLAR